MEKKKLTGWRLFTAIRRPLLFLFDVFCLALVDAAFYELTLLIGKPLVPLQNFFHISAVMLVAICVMRLIGRIYHSVWRYAETRTYLRLILCDAVAGALTVIYMLLHGWYTPLQLPVAVIPFNALLTLCSRFAYRMLYKRTHRITAVGEKNCTNIAIIGAGQLGVTLMRSLQSSRKTSYVPVCFVDIDPIKIGQQISGLPVFGGNDPHLRRLFEKKAVREIVVAINQLDKTRADFLYHHYGNMGYNVKVYDAPIMENNRASNEYVIRDFQIEDLLFRQPINYSQSLGYYAGKTVLVTGGGGSIGSELCRQLAACHPKKLIIFDIYENNAYDIQQELLQIYGDGIDLSVEIGSVRDRARMDYLFRQYRPQVVMHAAAHKHVPLMEQSSCEAVKNNIFGTYNTADMAEKYGAEQFILISSDKAVNPTNIMGATKRVCEMLIQCRRDSNTRFAAVRFGNVLGSNGSVIPLFQKQIKSGGPVTITDKRIERYFMTIPEASQLVLQAGSMAKNGELFVLDMGEPVKIYELARKMIRLCGLEPDVDIEIKEIGLRPGEKLFEELLIKGENHVKTSDDKIFIEWDTPLTRDEVEAHITTLRRTVEQVENGNELVSVQDVLMDIVPTFSDAKRFNARGLERERETVAAQ